MTWFKAPDFWWQSTPPPKLLTSLSYLYNHLQKYHQQREKRKNEKAPCPVISLGNLVMGGSGKTPSTLMLAALLKQWGASPLILTRGHGRTSKGCLLVNPAYHTPKEVGDEALLLANVAPTVVARNRKEGIALLQPFVQSHSVILMDDAHQHHSLYKDVSFLVMNRQQLLGNQHVFPAGPLRESIPEGLSRAQAILLIQPALSIQNPLNSSSLPLPENLPIPILSVSATFTTTVPPQTSVLAFAGLGYPQGFEHTLTALGLQIERTQRFPDHHLYTPRGEAHLFHQAQKAHLTLLTTEKDYLKLSPDFQKEVQVVRMSLVPQNEADIFALLRPILPFLSTSA